MVMKMSASRTSLFCTDQCNLDNSR